VVRLFVGSEKGQKASVAFKGEEREARGYLRWKSKSKPSGSRMPHPGFCLFSRFTVHEEWDWPVTG